MTPEQQGFAENPSVIAGLIAVIVTLSGLIAMIYRKLIKVIENSNEVTTNNSIALNNVTKSIDINTAVTKAANDKITELYIQTEIENALRKRKQ